MPELPEVETTKNGISPWVTGNRIEKLIIRVSKLRWMIESDIKKKPLGKVVQSVKRRAKYILLEMDHGSAIIHLGMSGSLRIIKSDEPPMKHDHFDIVFKNGNFISSYHTNIRDAICCQAPPEVCGQGFQFQNAAVRKINPIIHTRLSAKKFIYAFQRIGEIFRSSTRQVPCIG